MKKNCVFPLFLIFTLSLFAQQKNIVLELFTSQGCSSCPSADRLLKEVTESPEQAHIIALAYHVDYWNRLGWRDPFSKLAYTNYQQEYGRKFGGRSIYTPQLVINGTKHIVGSDKASLNTSFSKLKNKKLPFPISINNVTKNGTSISLEYDTLLSQNNRLNIVLVLKEHTTVVKRGENRNRILIDTHIVIDKKVIYNNDTSDSKITFEDVSFDLAVLEVVAYIQKDNLEIIGATKWN